MFEILQNFSIKLNYAIGITFFSTWLYLYYVIGKSINNTKPENTVLFTLLCLITALLSGIIVIGYYIATKLDALYL